MSALGQKRTCAAQTGMSALHPIATAKAKFRKRPCPLYPQKRTCAVHSLMSALGQKRTLGPAPFELGRLPAHNPFSTGRLSEDPTDYFVGICIETSAMAEQNTLRPPQVDLSNSCLRLLPLKE